MKAWVRCARGVQVANVTLHHRGCTLVPSSTWAKRVPRGAGRPTRHATALSPGWGSGPWAPGGRQVMPGEPHKEDPRNGGDLLCSQEGVHPVLRLGRREGLAGHGRCPVEVGTGYPQDPVLVPAGRDNKEEQGGARALLPEDLPSVWAPLVLDRGGGGAGAGRPSRGAREWPVGGREPRRVLWGTPRT